MMNGTTPRSSKPLLTKTAKNIPWQAQSVWSSSSSPSSSPTRRTITAVRTENVVPSPNAMVEETSARTKSPITIDLTTVVDSVDSTTQSNPSKSSEETYLSGQRNYQHNQQQQQTVTQPSPTNASSSWLGFITTPSQHSKKRNVRKREDPVSPYRDDIPRASAATTSVSPSRRTNGSSLSITEQDTAVVRLESGRNGEIDPRQAIPPRRHHSATTDRSLAWLSDTPTRQSERYPPERSLSYDGSPGKVNRVGNADRYDDAANQSVRGIGNSGKGNSRLEELRRRRGHHEWILQRTIRGQLDRNRGDQSSSNHGEQLRSATGVLLDTSQSPKSTSPCSREYENLSSPLDAMNLGNYREMQAKLLSTEKLVNELRVEHELAHNDKNQLESLVRELREEARRLETIAEETNVLREQLRGAEARITDLQRDSEQRDEERRVLWNELLDLRKSLAAADEQRKSLESQMQDRLESARLASAEKITEQIKIIESLSLENERLREVMEDLEDQLEFSDEKNKQLKIDLKESRSNRSSVSPVLNSSSTEKSSKNAVCGFTMERETHGIKSNLSTSDKLVMNHGNDREDGFDCAETKHNNLTRNVQTDDLANDIDGICSQGRLPSELIKDNNSQSAKIKKLSETKREQPIIGEDLANQNGTRNYEAIQDERQKMENEAELVKLTALLDSLTSENESLSNKLESSLDELARMQKRYLELEEAFNEEFLQLEAKHLDLMNSLETELFNSRTQTERVLRENDDLAREMGELRYNFLQLKEEQEKLESQALNGRQTVKCLEPSALDSDRIHELQSKVSDVSSRNEMLEIELRESNERLRDARAQISIYEENEAGRTSVTFARESLTAMVGKLRKEVSLAHQRADRAERQLKEMQESKNGINISELQTQLLQRESESRILQDELNEMQSKLIAARVGKEDVEEELSYSRAKLAELSNVLNKKTRAATEELLLVKCQQLAEVSTERDALKRKLDASEERVRTLEQECNAKHVLVQEISQSWNAAGSADENTAHLQEDYHQSVKKAMELSVQLAESKMEVDQLRKEVLQLRQKSQGPASAAPSIGEISFDDSNDSCTSGRGWQDGQSNWLDTPSQGFRQRIAQALSHSHEEDTTNVSVHANSNEALIRRLRQQVETLEGERNVYAASLSAVKQQLEEYEQKGKSP